MSSGSPRRWRTGRLAWSMLLLLCLDGALALRWSSWGRLKTKRRPPTTESLLREVLSPKSSLRPDFTSGFRSPRAAGASGASAAQAHVIKAPTTDLGGASEASAMQGALLRDSALETVFSSTAAHRLPRLARGPSIPLTYASDRDSDPDRQALHPTPAEQHHTSSGISAADPPAPELDVEEARIAGQLASIAYCSHPDLLAAWNCSRCAAVQGFQPYRVVYDTVWDLAAYAGYFSPWDAVVLAFRGTDSSNWGQWAENMRAWRTDHMYPVPDFPHALIHAGFFTLWTGSTLQSTFTTAVSELMAAHPNARMVVTGHSMGGALAQLAGLEFKLFYNLTRTTVYTFGAPRVGNLAYQQLFNSFVDVSWRFTHNRDIVPSVPLQLMGFQHVAREVWEVDVEDPGRAPGGVERKLLLCDATGEDPSCHNSACYLGLCTSIADHLTYLGLNMYQDSDEC